MSEILVTPDVVALLIAHLDVTLPTIPGQSAVSVTRAVPSPRPATFLTVRLLGGSRPDTPGLDRVTLTFEAYAATVAEAYDLGSNARGIVHGARGIAVGGTQIYQVNDFSAPVELPDPLSDMPRVTFSAELLVRITAP